MSCKDCRHPLIHNGTHQKDRLPDILLPENVSLDNRETKRFLSFAYEYAELLKYFNEYNTEDGDWQCFFSGGVLGLLSIITSIDLAAIDDKYCRTEAAFWEALKNADEGEKEKIKKEQFQLLIDCIYELVKKIHKICEETPISLDLKQEILTIIQTDIVQAVFENRIQNALIRLIAYDKANRPRQAHDATQDPFLRGKYAIFIQGPDNNSICTKAWSLADLDAFFCITPNDSFQEEQLPGCCKENRNLRGLFMIFFQALSKIVSRAEHYLQLEINNNHAQEPHISLFLAFVLLFRRLRAQLNGLTESHLNFYYEQVLCMNFRPFTPDQVHVIFELADGFENFPLTADTLLDAKRDEEGTPMLYKLDEPLVVSRAKVEDCNVLFLNVNETQDGFDNVYQLDIEQVGGQKSTAIRWDYFSERLLAGLDQNPIPFLGKGEVGFAVSDPILELRQGVRFLAMTLDLEGRPQDLPEDLIAEAGNGIRDITDHFSLFLSSSLAENGWLEIRPGLQLLSNFNPYPHKVIVNGQPVLVENNYSVLSSSNNIFSVHSDATSNKVEIIFKILIVQDDFVIDRPELEDKLFKDNISPLLKVVFKNELEDLIQDIVINNIRIDLEVDGLKKGIEIRNKDNYFNNDFPFPLLGAFYLSGNQLPTGAPLEFIIDELKGKQIVRLAPNPVYANPPASVTFPTADNFFLDRFDASFTIIDRPIIPADLNAIAVLGFPSLGQGTDQYLGTGYTIDSSILNLPVSRPVDINIGERLDPGSTTAQALTGVGLLDINQISLPGTPTNPWGGGTIPNLNILGGLPNFVNIGNLILPGNTLLPNRPRPSRLNRVSLRPSENTSNLFVPNNANVNAEIRPAGPILPEEIPLQSKKSYSSLRNQNILRLTYDPPTGSPVDPFLDNPAIVSEVAMKYTAFASFLYEETSSGDFFRKEEFKRYYITPTGYNYINPREESFQLFPMEHVFPPGPDGSYLLLRNNVGVSALANLHIGISELVPGQLLSLLFQLEEGTGNANFDPPEVQWFFLRKDEEGLSDVWEAFRAGSIVKDTTQTDAKSNTSLLHSGIIQFTTSPLMTQAGNSLRPGSDLFWIKAVIIERKDRGERIRALPNLIAVHSQAASATFENNENTLQHLQSDLPAETIAKLVNQVPDVQTVSQPISSFGGRPTEGRNAHYRRISERLRHKNRAINIWDYERLVLEAFPKVIHAKTISHTSKNCEIDPGKVMLVVFPDIRNRTDINRFTPGFGIGKLEAIEDYLRQRSNLFLYCDENIQVVNPFFELIQVKCCVRFRTGFDPAFYSSQLNEDLHGFLAPWIVDHEADLFLSGELHTSKIIQFIEELEYVDVISNFAVCHYTIDQETGDCIPTTGYDINGQPIPLAGELIRTTTARSILTTFPNGHDIRLWGEAGCNDCLAEDFVSFEICNE